MAIGQIQHKQYFAYFIITNDRLLWCRGDNLSQMKELAVHSVMQAKKVTEATLD